jgi:hypothetical protein
VHGCEDGGHGHVHPDIYRTELTFDPLRRSVYGFGVRHIGWDRQSAHAKFPQFSRCPFQSGRIAGQKSDIAAVASEFRSNRAANACSGTRDDHNLSQLGFLRLKLPQRGMVGLDCSNSWLMRCRAVRSALQTRPIPPETAVQALPLCRLDRVAQISGGYAGRRRTRAQEE